MNQPPPFVPVTYSKKDDENLNLLSIFHYILAGIEFLGIPMLIFHFHHDEHLAHTRNVGKQWKHAPTTRTRRSVQGDICLFWTHHSYLSRSKHRSCTFSKKANQPHVSSHRIRHQLLKHATRNSLGGFHHYSPHEASHFRPLRKKNSPHESLATIFRLGSNCESSSVTPR